MTLGLKCKLNGCLTKKSFLTKMEFVRSLFALYSLFVRFKSEGTAVILNPNSNLSNTDSHDKII
jgi:hypothetical protein